MTAHDFFADVLGTCIGGVAVGLLIAAIIGIKALTMLGHIEAKIRQAKPPDYYEGDK